MSPIETSVSQAEPADDAEDGRPSMRVGCHAIDGGDVSYDAAVQLHGAAADDPERFAEGLLAAALAVAGLRGAEFAAAATRTFGRYMPPPRRSPRP